MQPEGVGHNSRRAIRAEVVTTSKQWLHACAVRSICFMEENEVPADLLFDGNDYTSTHIIVYDGDEPVGAARLRWFKDFVKIERTCFRKAYRGIGVLKTVAGFVFAHVGRKGYTRVVTHASEKYARLWRTVLGFKGCDKAPVAFDGQEPFFEIWKDLEPAADAITAESSAAVLFRTEGAWDEPGAFER